ncbi:sulfur carrier protein ThiS [Paenibacillus chartarius]|uniref:Sulfur carrier protein ThiS n=1 Tax=Paenibacillus chartarius TaxID=747481 RepID=A0ABV6DPH8_9BACL
MAMHELIINGETVQVPEAVTTVSQLLAHFGLERKIVIVEINANIVDRGLQETTAVRSGDRIELVHFVGGG